jgi:hypothetical protein
MTNESAPPAPIEAAGLQFCALNGVAADLAAAIET